MRFQINSDVIRAWRYRLASLIAPAGADVHDPDETLCRGFEPYLNAVAWGEVHTDGTKQTLDISSDLDELAGRYGLIDYDEKGRPRLTDKGVREVAKMWGADRVPPWGGGLCHCTTHGTFEQRPGDRPGCPRCTIDRVLGRVASGR